MPIVRVCVFLIWLEGMYMCNLAETYSALGRHADALAMQERVLDLWRRFLPENDPEIGDHDVHSDSLLHVNAFIVMSRVFLI